MGLFKNLPAGSAEDYLKFKDGTSVQGVFRGDPHEYYSVFKDPTEFEAWKEGRTYRFKINFVVKEGKEWVARILQGGRKLQRQINSEVEEGGFDRMYRIKRIGSSKEDTTYTCIPMGELDPEELEAIKSVKLVPLSTGRKRSDDEVPPPDDSHFNPDTDIPTDNEDPGDIPF